MTSYKTCALALTTIASLSMAQSVAAQKYFEVFSEADAVNGTVTSPFIDAAVVAPDGTVYSTFRGGGSADVGSVTAFDGSGFSTVMTNAQYSVIGSTNDYATGNGLALVGDVLRGVSFFDNVVYEVNVNTGVITEVIPTTSFNAAVSAVSNLGSQYETAPDGTIYVYEQTSNQLLSVSPTNVISIEIDAATLTSDISDEVNQITGIGVNGTTLYIGSGEDTIIEWDTVTNTATELLSLNDIEDLTDDDDENLFFGDIFFAPDGLVYFYEGDSDYLMSFDPTNAANTVAVVLTEQELLDGPGTDLLGQLAWYEGNIAWTDQGDGFYAIPEPATAALLAIGGGLIAARRRRA
ncbi:MAG: PEP-CTERM sorting domain-containing protein [Planctomycetota bacterium]